MTKKLIGHSQKRREDFSLLIGKGTFVEDLNLPDTLHVAILRSPYAHAKIKKINVDKVLSRKGIVSLLTGKDSIITSRPLPQTVFLPGMKIANCYSLATDKVHFVGEPVAAVVGTSKGEAEDALEYFEVDYQPLKPVVDAEKAMQPDAPILYKDWGDNIRLKYKFEGGNIENAFTKADTVVKERFARHRYTAAPIEGRAQVVFYDPVYNTLTVWASTQALHILRSLLAESLDFPENRIRVIVKNVGGGFGPKLPLYQEEVLICQLALKVGKPVKWIESRREHLMAAAHSRQQVHYIEAAVTKKGKILGIKDRIIADLGASTPQPGLGSMLATISLIPSGYNIKNYSYDLSCVQTNKMAYGAVRGFGKADSNFIMERMINRIAQKLNIDPAEIRLRNFIQPDEFPYTSATGFIYDSGNYPKCLNLCLDMIGYTEFKKSQIKLRKKGVYQGIGLAFMLEPSANAVPNSYHCGHEGATIKMDPSGKVTLFVGVSSQGQGHETALSQIVADELCLPYDDIQVVEGDTSLCPYGLGAWASRFAIAGAGSTILACRKLKKKMKKIASSLLDTNVGQLAFKDQRIYVKHDAKKFVHYSDITNAAYKSIHKLPKGVDPTLDVTARYIIPKIQYIPDSKGRMNLYPSETAGMYAVIIEVDRETGVIKILKQVFVDDCGNMINPMTVDGQIMGGIAQGIGGSIFEELVYNEEGQLLSSTFQDYLMPTASCIPELKIAHVTTPSPITLKGFKGVGEGGCIPPPPALANAIEDALSPFRVKMLKQPLSPQNVWTAIKSASKQKSR